MQQFFLSLYFNDFSSINEMINFKMFLQLEFKYLDRFTMSTLDMK